MVNYYLIFKFKDMPVKKSIAKKTVKSVTPELKENQSCSCGEQKWWVFFTMLIILVVCMWWLSLYINQQLNNLKEWIWDAVSQQLEKMEVLKAWWEENYALLIKMYKTDWYKQRQSNSLQWAYAQFQQVAGDEETGWTDNQAAWESFATWTLTQDQLVQIKEWLYYRWDENAKITWLEYSEFACPYCQRQENDWVVSEVMEKYPWELNVWFKNYIVHDSAVDAANILECVWEVGWTSAYNGFLSAAFALEGQLDNENLLDIAAGLGADRASVKTCFEAKKYADKIMATSNEGRSVFGIQWTPWNVLINNETGEWVLIPWAYPAAAFQLMVDNLLWN